MTDTLREAFEAQAGLMGFDLTRQYIAVPEPWAEYVDEQTGYFWAGWQAGARHEREKHEVDEYTARRNVEAGGTP